MRISVTNQVTCSRWLCDQQLFSTFNLYFKHKNNKNKSKKLIKIILLKYLKLSGKTCINCKYQFLLGHKRHLKRRLYLRFQKN